MLKNELRQLTLELVEYHKLLRLSHCSISEHEQQFSDLVCEKISQLSYEYPIDNKAVPECERRRWSIYWDVRLGENFFENGSFLIKLKSNRESLIFCEYCGLKDRIYIE